MRIKDEKITFKIEAFENLADKITRNESVKARDFIEESQKIKAQAMKMYQNLVPRKKDTNEPLDRFFGDIEEIIIKNESEVTKKIMELTYRGKLDPQKLYDEILAKFIQKESAENLRFSELRETIAAMDLDVVRGCKVCYACAVCAACVGCLACAACVACWFTGTVALGAAGATKAAGLTGAAGAAGVAGA